MCANARLPGMLRLVSVATIFLFATSCAGASDPPADVRDSSAVPETAPSPLSAPASSAAEVYLPIYAPLDSVPEALLSGRLVEDDGCLWIETSAGRALPMWPSGSKLERDGTSLEVVNTGGARAVVGTQVVAGGGGYGPEHYDFVVELIGQQVPDACRGEDSYLLVYGVRTEGH